MKEEHLIADIVIYNGKVLTVNETNDVAEAVAIRDNKILNVGNYQNMQQYIGKHTKLIDAKNKTVMPGFIDAHIHVALLALLNHAIINISYPIAKSIEDIKQIIRQEAAKKKKGEWILLMGYDQDKLLDKRHPTKEDLDEAAPDHPVLCARSCAHLAVYNSYAFRLAGITDGSKFGPGEIVLNENGELHGLTKESANSYIASKAAFDEDAILAGLKTMNDLLLSYGITSIHDGGCNGSVAIKAMQRASKNGDMKVRIYPMIFTIYGKEPSKELIHAFTQSGIRTGLGNENFMIGPAKIMIDGSTSGPSAAMIDGYSHEPSNHGVLTWEAEEAKEMVVQAHKEGFQVTAHATGDQAVTIMVDAYEKALEQFPKKGHRHRIEHCALTNTELLTRIADLELIPVSNPAFLINSGSAYQTYYGERTNYMFPLQSYLERGIINAFGSDAPAGNMNPMYSLHGALNRMDMKTGEVIGECQRIDILNAVRMFTYNGAYASFEENIKGSIEKGKLADVIILSEDILSYPVEEIQNVKVLCTIIDGEIVYDVRNDKE